MTIGFGLITVTGALLLYAGPSGVSILPGLAVTVTVVAGQALPGAMMAAVPHSRAGMASGALNTFHQLGIFALLLIRSGDAVHDAEAEQVLRA